MAGSDKKSLIRNLPLEAVERGFLYTLGVFVLGIVLLIWPGKSVWFVYCTAAVAMILLGAWRIRKYFAVDSAEEGREHQVFAQGLVLAIGGILLLVYMQRMAEWIPVLAGAAMLFIAAIRVQAAVDVKRLGFGLWYIPLCTAIATAVCGATVLVFHIQQDANMIMLGALLVLEALCDLTCRLVIRSFEKHPASVTYTDSAEAPAGAPAAEAPKPAPSPEE